MTNEWTQSLQDSLDRHEKTKIMQLAKNDLTPTMFELLVEADKKGGLGVRNNQIGGAHYKYLKIQPFDFIIENNLNWCQGNVVKYITRYPFKNGVEDLLKAKHYIEIEIDRLQSKTTT